MSIKGQGVRSPVIGIRVVYVESQRRTVLNLAGHGRLYDGDFDMCTYEDGVKVVNNQAKPGTDHSERVGCGLSRYALGKEVQFRRYSGVYIKIRPGHPDFMKIITDVGEAMLEYAKQNEAAQSTNR